MNTTLNMMPKMFPNIHWAAALTFLLLILQVVGGILYLVACFAFALLSGRLFSDINPEEFLGSTSILVINPVAFGLVLVIIMFLNRKLSCNILDYKKLSLSLVTPIFLISMGVWVICSEMDNLCRYFIPTPDLFKDTMNELQSLTPGTLVVVCLIAPITEELIFRGCFLRAFLTRHSITLSIFASAVLFGLLHVNPIQIPYSIFYGIILGWIYYKTSSLSLCTFSHILMNSTSCLALYLSSIGYKIPGLTEQTSSTFTMQPIWFNLLGLGLAIAGFWLLHKRTNHEPEQERAPSFIIPAGFNLNQMIYKKIEP